MDPKQFDGVIAGLTELGVKIAAINARPFMPDADLKLNRITVKAMALSQGQRKPGAVPTHATGRKTKSGR